MFYSPWEIGRPFLMEIIVLVTSAFCICTNNYIYLFQKKNSPSRGDHPHLSRPIRISKKEICMLLYRAKIREAVFSTMHVIYHACIHHPSLFWDSCYVFSFLGKKIVSQSTTFSPLFQTVSPRLIVSRQIHSETSALLFIGTQRNVMIHFETRKYMQHYEIKQS